jgi:hypothetical protein
MVLANTFASVHRRARERRLKESGACKLELVLVGEIQEQGPVLQRLREGRFQGDTPPAEATATTAGAGQLAGAPGGENADRFARASA